MTNLDLILSIGADFDSLITIEQGLAATDQPASDASDDQITPSRSWSDVATAGAPIPTGRRSTPPAAAGPHFDI